MSLKQPSPYAVTTANVLCLNAQSQPFLSALKHMRLVPDGCVLISSLSASYHSAWPSQQPCRLLHPCVPPAEVGCTRPGVLICERLAGVRAGARAEGPQVAGAGVRD